MTDSLMTGRQNDPKVQQAAQMLEALGFKPRGNRFALILLALAGVGPENSWANASAPLLQVVEVMEWLRENYGFAFAPNTRENFRQALRTLHAAGLIAHNPDHPARPVTSAQSCYQLQPHTLEALRRYGTTDFAQAAENFVAAVSHAEAAGRSLADDPNLTVLLGGLVSSPSGLRAAELAVIEARRRVIAEVKRLATTPGANETTMQKALQDHHWIFGGQYIALSPRRDLMPMQQHDILLVAADKSLTIVELKGPQDPLLSRPRDNHLTVSGAINDAVGQCMNYLRAMDEFGLAMSTRAADELALDYDFRRANAVVVIGHPGWPGRVTAQPGQVEQVLRLYNSHLSRIKVLTYADLLDAAERQLAFDA